MKQAALLFCLGFLLWGVCHSPLNEIYGPLLSDPSEPIGVEALAALEQPYRFLGKGRQSVAFASDDGKWVLKFFIQAYFKVPFWAFFSPRHQDRREKRKAYYRQSYKIAAELFREETGIVYLHQGFSPTPLPKVSIEDRFGRIHQIDLNEMPFVMQKRAEPFYPYLETLDSKGFGDALDRFFAYIEQRIERGVGDGDHNVENNYGMLEGRIIHIDPGRLYRTDHPWEREKVEYEWWSATHGLRKWLEKSHPEHLSRFDSALETNLQKSLRQSPASPSPQIGESPREQFRVSSGI